MSSNGTSSVLTRIRHAWEPRTATSKQHQLNISSTIDLIVAEYDVIVDQLGRSFVNALLESDLHKVADGELARLHDLVGGQITAKSSGLTPSDDEDILGYASGASALARSELQGWEEEVQNLISRASEKTIQALHGLAFRLGYIPPSESQDPSVPKLPSSHPDIKTPYCEGALLLQNSKTDVYSVIKQQSTDQDYSCKYCFLEISDFRSSSLNYTKEDWFLLASCHVQTCRSRKDRRAAYRCFACFYSRGHKEIEPSAAAFRVHLNECQFMKLPQKKQSSPVSQSQRNFSSRSSLPSDTLARGSSASLDVSPPSYTKTHRSAPPRDKRDAVPVSNGNRATTVTHWYPEQGFSPVSADETRPTIPLKPLRTNTTG
jgi:hypothetical protein